MYRSIEELIKQAKEQEIPLWQVVLNMEMHITEATKEEIYEKYRKDKKS